MAERRAILANRDFRLWLSARTLSLTGTEASAVALPILVYNQSGSVFLTSLVSTMMLLPHLLFGLFAGAVADRANRRRILVTAEVAAAAALAAVPVMAAFGLHSPAAVLAVTFVVWTCSVWFDAAAFGGLFRLVGREGLASANSLVWSSGTAAGAIAPALAGALIAFSSAEAVLLADALTCLASAVLLLRVLTALSELRVGRAPHGGHRTRLAVDIREGLAFVWHEPRIRALTLATAGLTLSAGAVIGILVVYVDRQLDGGADWLLGFLLGAGAAGAFALTLAMPRLRTLLGPGRLAICTLLALVPLTLVLAWTSTVWVAAGAWVLWSGIRTLAVANTITLRQELTPDALQGRVNTTGRLISLGGMPLGTLLGGVAASVAGVQLTYLFATFPVLAAGLYLLSTPVRSYRPDPVQCDLPDVSGTSAG